MCADNRQRSSEALCRTAPAEASFGRSSCGSSSLGGQSLSRSHSGSSSSKSSESHACISSCSPAAGAAAAAEAAGPFLAGYFSDAEAIIRDIIGEFIYGRDDDTLEAIILRELTARFQTLAIAESCTGGIISHRFTNVPGASAVFLAGHCTYANTAKQATLGVTSETLAEHGAVSEPTARQMAEGARTIHNADYALATTGIAGPGGGTEEKPVGTVFMALATNDGTEIVKRLNRFDRETFKQVTAQQTMDLLRRKLTI